MVSIIIPCYNAEETLAATIDSVLRQTNSDWEIIAVDDGSTDSTLDLLNKLKALDSRIRIIHQENGGVSSARNIGIKNVKGEWIYFLDSDDLIDDTLVEKINSQPSNVQMVVFNFAERLSTRERIHRIRSLETLFSDYLVNKQTIHISSIATRKNLIIQNSVYFDETTSYGEDREFVAKLLALAPIINQIKKTLFTYIYREGSAMTNKVYSKKRFSSVLASERTYQGLIGRPEENNALTILAFTIARHLKMFYDYKCDNSELEMTLWQYVDKYLKTQRGIGFGKVEIYTTLVRMIASNSRLLKLFLKLY